MIRYMGNYYRIEDPYKGPTCTLTGVRCGSGTCKECMFAKTAFEKEANRRNGERSDDAWYTVIGINNVPLDVTSPDKPFTFLGQCQCRHDAIECKRNNRDRFDRVIVVRGMASPADLFEIMEEVD